MSVAPDTVGSTSTSASRMRIAVERRSSTEIALGLGSTAAFGRLSVFSWYVGAMRVVLTGRCFGLRMKMRLTIQKRETSATHLTHPRRRQHRSWWVRSCFDQQAGGGLP